VGNVKRRNERTYTSVEIAADDRQQLRLEVLEYALYLRGRVRFGDVTLSQRRRRRQVGVGDVHALTIR
jgi:hypothetical protein